MQHRIRLRPPHIWTVSLILGFGLFIFALTSSISPVQAAPGFQPSSQEDKPDNDYCLACHQEAGKQQPLGTNACHNDQPDSSSNCPSTTKSRLPVWIVTPIFKVSPHRKVEVDTLREFTLSFLETCGDCHEEEYTKTHDSVHQAAFDKGNQNAPVCMDCHNPHTQTRLTGKSSGELTPSARLKIPTTCAQCHEDIYNTYRNSVHGKALTEEGNVDVPTCIDCHGVHDIQDPTTVTFRNSTPFLCATCHTDEDKMAKYHISTNVLNSYVSDFHGATVKLFEEQFPGQPTNKPVCTDCHGVHDISRPSDPETGIGMQENLLVKCQRCHPDATANFPAAWMSHYEPSPEHYPIVYYVNLFYKFFIPAVLGGMIFFVLTDIYRRIVNRMKGVKH